MIEYLGLLYGLLKDVKKYLTYDEKITHIDRTYPDTIKKEQENKGNNIEFCFSEEDKIPTRKKAGWDYFYEIDEAKRTKSIIGIKHIATSNIFTLTQCISLYFESLLR